MPCYHPLTAYRSKQGRDPKTGKWPIVFNVKDGYSDLEVKIPCGKCIGCRLEKSRQWAIRCIHEASLYDKNCFITLTFDDDHLDPHKSLNKRDFQLFMKRLRKKYGEGIRFYHCGEYGSINQRPHHHACLFNFDFPDKKLWTVRNGVPLYRSAELEKLWPFGFSTIGEVTFESAAYVARYIMKKINGKKSFMHYAIIDKETGEYFGQRQPEYTTMSRRPGIGREWFEKFKGDIYPHDYVVIKKGLKCRPPAYYDRLYDLTDPEEFSRIKARRRVRARNNKDNTPQRLKVKEMVKWSQISRLVRDL